MLRRNKDELVARERGFADELDAIFDGFRSGLEDLMEMPGFLPALSRGNSGRRPAVDLVDKGAEFVVTAELPGVSRENLDIEVGEHGAKIRAKVASETKKEESGYYFHERSSGSWYRRLAFPATVVPNRAEAELKEGVLTLRVPKAEPTYEEGARKVQVK